MIKEFREFIMRGSVIDLAVGIIIGGAFGVIVKSMVDDVIMPLIGLALAGIDFKHLAITLKAAAGDKPAVLLNYGLFINAVINFVIIGFVIFLIIKAINRLKCQPPPPTPSTKACAQCLESIHKDAKRCKFCTSPA